jgi:hypothetical protein
MELQKITEMFNAQAYKKKQLWIIASPEIASRSEADLVLHPEHALNIQIGTSGIEHICFFDVRDYYGTNYLTDLALGHWYSGAFAVGKHCHVDGDKEQIVNDGMEYRFVRGLEWRNSLVAVSAVPELTFGKFLEEFEMEVALPVCLALDRFNYYRNAKNDCASVMDKPIENRERTIGGN